MALIKCPECEKEISDTTNSCPHCGYKLSNDSNFKKTEIHSLPAKKGVGAYNLFIGIFVLIISIITMFLFGIFGIIIGIIEIGVGLALIKSGKDNVKGALQEANCPYCGKDITFAEDKTRIECIYCKQVSVKNDNYLTPIK
ncbi:zinc-ribbon domain-containing protein [Porcipelethomonas sp.]|uniref:zinc-ribbon domain-containing protein n=1 Tax=Porcipelethomonas sp. TaxID=2981675 RepID=UPI003EF1C13E